MSIGLKLRPYQLECLEAIQQNLEQGVNSQLVSLPCGAGKTVVFANLIKQMERRTLVLAHTNELLEQAKEKILMICPDLKVGIVNGKLKEFESDIVISSIQSARQPENLNKLKAQGFSLVIYDEAHHSGAESPRKVLSELGFTKTPGNNKLLIGFTATAFRNDSKGLLEVFEKIVYQKNIKEMIADGYLCKPNGIRVATDLNLDKVKTSDEDFSATSLAQVMNTPELNQLVVQTYIDRANNRKAICFGVTINHATNLSDRFNANGVPSACVHGNMSNEEREATIKKFERNEIKILTNCQVLAEGFDIPSVDCVIMARPTKSTGLYIQNCGRGLRLWPGKTDCLIIDFGEVSHDLCGINILIGDSEKTNAEKYIKNCNPEFARSLPQGINQELKKAVLEIDILGQDFTWQKDQAGVYFLSGNSKKSLKIIPISEERYNVIFIENDITSRIATNLSFEYAFSAAEAYAKDNRGLFVINDLTARWRDDPISEKQLETFRKAGYRSGLEDLTKGQACQIIQTGILWRHRARKHA